jgi:hypothetical protein
MIHGKGLFLLKTATQEAKNMPAHCGKESMSDLSITHLAYASWQQQAFLKPPRGMSN